MVRRVPRSVKALFWDQKGIDVEKQKRRVLVRVINYGKWSDWRWLFSFYGRERVKELIKDVPASEFRPGALALAMTLLNIDNLPYVSRSDYIRSKTRS